MIPESFELVLGIFGSPGGDSDDSESAIPASGFKKVLGGIVGSLGGMFGGLFGGHKVLGGGVRAGVAYDVGEMGRETFVPSSNGTIIPNNLAGGGGHTYNIDARNSHDNSRLAGVGTIQVLSCKLMRC